MSLLSQVVYGIDFFFDRFIDMKFSIEDINNVNRKRSASRKPRKMTEKRPCMGLPATPFVVVPP